MAWRAAALRVLETADPREKCAAANDALGVLCDDIAVDPGLAQPPADPARPAAPILLPPTDVPKRRFGSIEGRAAALHALAHIEFNAIDLAFDMAARFAGEIASAGLPAAAFVHDWFQIGAEEAGHFSLISTRLGELGSHYGAMPAHGGLWDAARETSDSVLARLTIVPMVLEARGLDVTPGLGRRFHNVGDEPSARLIERILADEIGHVAAGVRWFTQVCEAKKLDAEAAFRTIVSDRFRGGLKPPFNQSARDEAGFPTSFYTDWNSPCGTAIHRGAGSH